MLETRASSEPRVDPGTMDLVCFGIAPGDHGSVTARLAEAGVPVEASTGFTLYFRDPDGRRIGASSYPTTRAPL